MIGLLEIRRRKLQFGLIGAVMALIAYLLLTINGLGAGLNYAAGGAVSSLDADFVGFAPSSSQEFSRSQLTTDQIEAISAVEGVDEAAPISFSRSDYIDATGSRNSTGFFGYQPGTIGEPGVTAGRQLEEGDTGILVDRSFVEDSGFKTGDTVTLTVELEEREFEILGEVDQGSTSSGRSSTCCSRPSPSSATA